MSCAEFDRWLDDGAPSIGESVALAHARDCARCATGLGSARELDQALASFAALAPAELTARIMSRVAALPRRAVWAPAPSMEWWVRAAADPATVLALVLAGLVAWRVDAVPRAATALAQGTIAGAHTWLAGLAAPAGSRIDWITHPDVAIALTLAILPALLWGSWRLFTWAERACAPIERRASH